MQTALLISALLSATHDTDPNLTRPSNNRSSAGWLAAGLAVASAGTSVALGAGLLVPRTAAFEAERLRLEGRGRLTAADEAYLPTAQTELRDLQIGTAVTAVAAGAFGFTAIALLVIWPGNKASSAPVALAPTFSAGPNGAHAGVVGVF